MTKAKAPTLYERVAKLEEAAGLRTTAAPPPEKPECVIYGRPATSKAIFEMYVTEAAARKAVQYELGAVTARLADVEKALKGANSRGDAYLAQYQATCRELAHERATRPPLVRQAPTSDPFFGPSAVSYAGLSGLLLGALAGGLLL